MSAASKSQANASHNPRVPSERDGLVASPHVEVKLPLSVKLIYGWPKMGTAALGIVNGIWLKKFYIDDVLMDPARLAMWFSILRAVDLVLGLCWGWILDNTSTEWGRRRPWIAACAPIVSCAYIMVYNPSSENPQLYYVVFYGLIVSLPLGLVYDAWGPELTQHPSERSSLFAYCQASRLVGAMLGGAVPGMLIKYWTKDHHRVFAAFVMPTALIWFVSNYLLVWKVKERDYSKTYRPPFVPSTLRIFRFNQPFRVLLTVYSIAACAALFSTGLLPFFLQYVLKLQNYEVWISILLACGIISGLISVPFWIWVAKWMGRRNCWLLVGVLQMPASLAIFFFVQTSKDLLIYCVLMVWSGFCLGGSGFLSSSIRADVIDYDELYFGKRREAQFITLWELFPRFITIPGTAIPLGIVSVLGYVPNEPNQNDDVVLAFRCLVSLCPFFFSCFGVLFAFMFPIDDQIHAGILNGIALHKRGIAAIDPLTAKLVPAPLAGIHKSLTGSNSKVLDEKTSWFLDTFFPVELKRVHARGSYGCFVLYFKICSQMIASSVVGYYGTRLMLENASADSGEGLAIIGVLLLTPSLILFGCLGLKLVAARRLHQNLGVYIVDIPIHLDMRDYKFAKKSESKYGI